MFIHISIRHLLEQHTHSLLHSSMELTLTNQNEIIIIHTIIIEIVLFELNLFTSYMLSQNDFYDDKRKHVMIRLQMQINNVHGD